MDIDRLTVTAEITRKVGSDESIQLNVLFASGERVIGLIDQFPWMPFIVISKTVSGNAVTFDLRMVNK